MNERESRMARGLEKAELVLKNGTIVNVFTEELLPGDVAISGGKIVGVGSYAGEREIDCTGKYIAPGLIDAHMHMESSMLIPGELAKVLVRAGTTTIVADPHEAVNVRGAAALDWLLAATEHILTTVYLMVPSSVPATDWETNGAGEFLAEAMRPYLAHPRVLGLGETMRFQEVLAGEKRMTDKIALFRDKFVDGHAPGITGGDVQAYRLAGVDNDHECATAEEALEKLRAGFAVFAREGSGAKNVETLLRGLLEAGVSLKNVMFCTDDKHTAEIRAEGHVSACVRKAIALGVPAARAYAMGSYNTACHYGIRDRGAVGAGYQADLLILDDLEQVRPRTVLKDGVVVTEELLARSYAVPVPQALYHTVQLRPLTAADLAVAKKERNDVIAMNPHQLVTTHLREQVPGENGVFRPDGVWNKLCVAERHGHGCAVGAAPLKGFGIRGGALATTVAHDSHNLIAAGDNDEDILLAMRTLEEVQGGYVLVSGGQVVGTLPLPVCGLMSEADCGTVEKTVADLVEKAHEMGVSREVDPFITLSFMALTVIPALRLTERGLFDVTKMEYLKD